MSIHFSNEKDQSLKKRDQQTPKRSALPLGPQPMRSHTVGGAMRETSPAMPTVNTPGMTHMVQSLKKKKAEEQPFERKFYMRHQAQQKDDEDKENNKDPNKSK